MKESRTEHLQHEVLLIKGTIAEALLPAVKQVSAASFTVALAAVAGEILAIQLRTGRVRGSAADNAAAFEKAFRLGLFAEVDRVSGGRSGRA